MNRLLAGLVLIAGILVSAPAAHAATMVAGKVVYTKAGCDYYIVSDTMGYVLLEWFGGRTPVEGDYVVGEINSYGIKDLYVAPVVGSAQTTKAWVEDYMLTTSSVVQKFINKCPTSSTRSSTYTPTYYSPTYTSPTYPTYSSGYSSNYSGLSNSNYYTNSAGNTVHSPAYSATVPSSASAVCGDGTYSFSQSRSGTCSHHGGVSSWY